jgi:hypothetical protein
LAAIDTRMMLTSALFVKIGRGVPPIARATFAIRLADSIHSLGSGSKHTDRVEVPSSVEKLRWTISNGDVSRRGQASSLAKARHRPVSPVPVGRTQAACDGHARFSSQPAAQ